ncbi:MULTISPECIES: protein kinase family protein [Gracilibacillus]|uniref:hypothetical protein n=1 Tax=Gracilibacillus TaxID=74385 RepID=UPI000825B403|nr:MULTISPECIES: hypothetical protein [Gracilibacillus]
MHSVFLHYPMQVPVKPIADQPYMTYQDQSTYYFVVPSAYSEEAALEWYSIASYYHQQGFTNVTCPIPNIHNQFITTVGKEQYVVCYAYPSNFELEEGQMLAAFQQIGFQYPYQPKEINHYGRWRQLWSNKTDQYELVYKQLYQQRPANSILRDTVNLFPYIVGLAENAIQYLHVVEQERQFSANDQPTITFGRYQKEMKEDFIYSPTFIYDHPVRDLAEKIRHFMLEEEGLRHADCERFLRSYLSQIPLSAFGWKLLYARLLFPIHLFDLVDQIQQTSRSTISMEDIITQQHNYQQHLASFFYQLGVDERDINGIQLDWLTNI